MSCVSSAESDRSTDNRRQRTSSSFSRPTKVLCNTLLVLSVAALLATQVPLGPSVAGPQHVALSGELPAAFSKAYPTSLEELASIEDHVAALTRRVKKATVAVQVGRAFGSGVIVSNDGYVLTAGHVSGDPDRQAFVVMPDGKRYRAKTLGQNITADSGLMKIESDRGDWSFVDMAPAASASVGDWVVALGHPGGVKAGRDAVLRLGRILHIDDRLIQTDCELVGGDSGGPLFDMRGRVIAINSRIAERADMNFHVPVAMYLNEWDRLAASESYSIHSGAYLGVKGRPDSDGLGLKVTEVESESAAQRAGLRVGDVVVRFQGQPIRSIDDLIDAVGVEQVGARVKMTILRDERPVVLRPRLGERARG